MTLEEEKIINKRIFGFAFGFFALLLFSLVWLAVDEKVIGVVCVALALLQIGFMLITPRCYVFSRERLVIKYFFGLEENIPWQDIRAITQWYEEPSSFFWLNIYDITYYSEEKRKFFMRGQVAKNKKIKRLMQKYCTKKHEW